MSYVLGTLASYYCDKTDGLSSCSPSKPAKKLSRKLEIVRVTSRESVTPGGVELTATENVQAKKNGHVDSADLRLFSTLRSNS